MKATRPRHSDEYTAYIRSPAWTARKRRWDAMASPRQKRCQARSWRCHGPLHHHHRTYARLTRERHRDLVILCEHHHRCPRHRSGVHDYGRRHHLNTVRASRYYLWAARLRRYAVVLLLAALLVYAVAR